MESIHNRYAVVVELNGLMSESAKAAWRVLEKSYKIKFISSNSTNPHLTLISGFSGNLESIVSMLKKFISKCKGFKIRGNGLGVFLTDSPVVFIRWLLTQEFYEFTTRLSNTLMDLQQVKLINGFVPNYNWLAKSTIAYKDVNLSQLSNILHDLECYNFNAPMLVNNLCLYEYNPLGKEKNLLCVPI